MPEKFKWNYTETKPAPLMDRATAGYTSLFHLPNITEADEVPKTSDGRGYRDKNPYYEYLTDKQKEEWRLGQNRRKNFDTYYNKYLGSDPLYRSNEQKWLAEYLAFVESRWNPQAQNEKTNAKGLFQIMPQYWGSRNSKNIQDQFLRYKEMMNANNQGIIRLMKSGKVQKSSIAMSRLRNGYDANAMRAIAWLSGLGGLEGFLLKGQNRSDGGTTQAQYAAAIVQRNLNNPKNKKEQQQYAYDPDEENTEQEDLSQYEDQEPAYYYDDEDDYYTPQQEEYAPPEDFDFNQYQSDTEQVGNEEQPYNPLQDIQMPEPENPSSLFQSQNNYTGGEDDYDYDNPKDFQSYLKQKQALEEQEQAMRIEELNAPTALNQYVEQLLEEPNKQFTKPVVQPLQAAMGGHLFGNGGDGRTTLPHVGDSWRNTETGESGTVVGYAPDVPYMGEDGKLYHTTSPVVKYDSGETLFGVTPQYTLPEVTATGHLRTPADDLDKVMLGTLATGVAPMALPKIISGATAALANPYVDAALTSYFGAHGINDIANGNANAMTALEVLPMARLAKPLWNAGKGAVEQSFNNGIRRIFGEVDTFNLRKETPGNANIHGSYSPTEKPKVSEFSEEDIVNMYPKDYIVNPTITGNNTDLEVNQATEFLNNILIPRAKQLGIWNEEFVNKWNTLHPNIQLRDMGDNIYGMFDGDITLNLKERDLDTFLHEWRHLLDANSSKKTGRSFLSKLTGGKERSVQLTPEHESIIKDAYIRSKKRKLTEGISLNTQAQNTLYLQYKNTFNKIPTLEEYDAWIDSMSDQELYSRLSANLGHSKYWGEAISDYLYAGFPNEAATDPVLIEKYTPIYEDRLSKSMSKVRKALKIPNVAIPLIGAATAYGLSNSSNDNTHAYGGPIVQAANVFGDGGTQYYSWDDITLSPEGNIMIDGNPYTIRALPRDQYPEGLVVMGRKKSPAETWMYHGAPINREGSLLQDIGYRLMTSEQKESRGIGDIINAVSSSIRGLPYNPQYTGNIYWDGDNSYPNINRNLHYLSMYGNTKGQFEPDTIKYGFNYSNYLNNTYPGLNVPTFKGQIFNVGSGFNLVSPDDYVPLIQYLSNTNKGTYTHPETGEDEPLFEDYSNTKFGIDDTGSARVGLFYNPETQQYNVRASDIIDYGGKGASGYFGRWGIKAGIQGNLLSQQLTHPALILNQEIPIKISNNDADYIGGNSLAPVLESITADHNILQKSNDPNADYIYPFPYGELNVTPQGNDFYITRRADVPLWNRYVQQQTTLQDYNNNPYSKKFNTGFSIRKAGGPLI